MKATMVKTSKVNVKTDFLNAVKHRIKKPYSAQLLEQWKSGNLKLRVSTKLKKDGETSFDEKNRTIKQSTVTIKKKVALSKHICWRMSILLHELAHVLHYFNTKGPIYVDETHGKEWMVELKSTIERGGLKECAKKLRSPSPRCIYKQICLWCTPNGERVPHNKEYSFPNIQETSRFGGNCLYCFTSESTIKHLKRSISCKEKYVNLYGPQYIAKVKNAVAKEKRQKKRPVNITGPSVCCFCPAQRDNYLFLHLKANADCTKKYMSKYKCQTEEGLRIKISKEKAKLRKRKQRAKLQKEGE